MTEKIILALGLNGLFHNYSYSSLFCESRHRQHVNKPVLCSPIKMDLKKKYSWAIFGPSSLLCDFCHILPLGRILKNQECRKTKVHDAGQTPEVSLDILKCFKGTENF